MNKFFLIIFILVSFMLLVKGDFNETEIESSYHTYTYNCKELYKQKEMLEQQIYNSDNVRQLYKEVSQMIYQLCYKNEL